MGTHDEKRREVKTREGYVEPPVDDITKKIASGEISELVVVAEGEESTTWFVWLLVFCSSISGLLFGQSYLFCSRPPCLIRYLGYDTGVVSGALVSIGSDLGPESLSNLQKVWVGDMSEERPPSLHPGTILGIYHFCHHAGSTSW